MVSDPTPLQFKRRVAALSAIFAVAAGLRLLQYAASNSLWLDELYIALNVTRSGWGDLLFEPLAYNQVAPLGFLALEKLATSLLGNGELVLRFFPTFFSLISMILFWRVCTRFLEGGSLLVALGLFAINPVFLWTARNTKQYSGDIMVVLVLLLLALRFREGKNDIRSTIIAGVVGGLGILLSQPAVIVGALLVSVLFLQSARTRPGWGTVLPVGIWWGVGMLVAAITSLILVPASTRANMRGGWRRAFVAAPWDDPVSLPRLFFRYVAYIFGSMIPDTPAEIALAVFLSGMVILGIVRLARRQPGVAALLMTPLAATILASALRLLPFSGRVSAYAAPTLLVGFSAGLFAVLATLPARLRPIAAVAALVLAAGPGLAQVLLIPPFQRREDARPILEEVRERWRPGDTLYSLPGGRRAMEYYGEPMGLVPWVSGESHGGQPRSYLIELDPLRGRPRVWFFYTHAQVCEPETVISYLDSIGTRIEVIQDRQDNRGKREAAAYLYDLSDPRLLARSTPATHPVPSRKDCGRASISQGEMIKRQVRELLSRLS